jgi:hypothetical protein
LKAHFAKSPWLGLKYPPEPGGKAGNNFSKASMADFLSPSVNFLGRGPLAETGPRAKIFRTRALLATDKVLAGMAR